MNYNDTQLILAQSLFDNGRFHDALKVLEPMVAARYLPAYPVYLWAIWGDGNYYQRFIKVLNDGIAAGSADCEYIKLWKEFSNRPAVDEYWDEITRLAMLGQPNALLALSLHTFLEGDKTAATNMLCDIYSATEHPERVHTLKEVRSFMYKTMMNTPTDKKNCVEITNRLGTTQLLENVRYIEYGHYDRLGPFYRSNDVSTYQEWFPYRYLYNDQLSNEEFNATVFTKKRMLERKRIARGEALSYADIKDAIMTRMPADVRVMEGLTKNSWMYDDAEKEQKTESHSIYIMKKLDDGRWMTLRIGDHTSNLGDYYKYRRMYVPSSRPYANMCIMLHGDREQMAGMKYSFRFNAATADPCVTVRDEDFQVYRPFMYTLVHYIPGLITDVDALCSAILEWIAGDGLVPYNNPFYNETDDNPTARITGGLAKIETWDIKYERRRREVEKKMNAVK